MDLLKSDMIHNPRLEFATKIKEHYIKIYNNKIKIESEDNTFSHICGSLQESKGNMLGFWKWTSIDSPLGLSSGVDGEFFFQKLIS